MLCSSELAPLGSRWRRPKSRSSSRRWIALAPTQEQVELAPLDRAGGDQGQAGSTEIRRASRRWSNATSAAAPSSVLGFSSDGESLAAELLELLDRVVLELVLGRELL